MSFEHAMQNGEGKRTVDDPGEYNQIRRLERLHDARLEVNNLRRKMADATISGMVTQHQRDELYFETVTGLVLELEAMLVDEQLDGAQKYWKQIELGKIVLSPPEEAKKEHTNHVGRLVPGSKPPERKEIEVRGLGNFLDLEPPFVSMWTVAWKKKGGFETKEFSAETTVPRRVSDNAYRACNRFLRDVGVDAKLAEVREATQIEWDFEE